MDLHVLTPSFPTRRSSDLASEQFRYIRDAECSRVVGANLERRHQLPIKTDLVVSVSAEQVVVGIAHRSIEREHFGERLVLEQGQCDFRTRFIGGVLARNRILLVAVGDAEDGELIRITPTTVRKSTRLNSSHYCPFRMPSS